MTRRNLWACVGLALALVVGCGDDDRPATDAGITTDAVVGMDSGPPGCPTGTMLCGDTCVDTNNSRANCGACGTACAAGEACTDGMCDVLCPATQVECDGACADTMTDRNNCGACGTACAAGEVCVDGSCALSCPAGQTVCGTGCVDTQSNPAHCGGCDAACDPGQVCSEGVCATSCGTGLTECSGACVDVQNNPLHCSACDAACTAPTGASGLCVAGSCVAACDPLQGDCNADIGAAGGDGCETPLGTDPTNCGACGRVCEFPNAVTGCAAGDCTIAACDTGFGDCDGLTANGCETDVNYDNFSCGACGTVCPTGDTCVRGMCETTVGETCSDAVALTVGTNTIDWMASSLDYVPVEPSCTTSDAVGPDIVLTYTATADERVTITFTNTTRWVAIVSTSCGVTSSLTCISAVSSMNGSFFLRAGETAYIHVADTDSGTATLDDPLNVIVTTSTPACMPGTGGRVRGLGTRVPTGAASFTENYLAVDQDPAGYVYFGGASNLYRMPKAGGAVEDVEVAAGLSTEMGYDMLVDGPNIYVLDTATGTTGRLYRISTTGGNTWSLVDYASFATAPADDFRGMTAYSGRVYMVTEEDTSTVDTEIWSVDGAATTLPAAATLDASVTGFSDCFGIDRDTTYYYLVCDDPGDRVIRVPVAGGAAEVVTTSIPVNTTNATLVGDDLDGDGTFDVLYVQTDRESVHFVCDPDGATPIVDTLFEFGTGTLNYGLGFDRTANVLWMIDDGNRDLIRIE